MFAPYISDVLPLEIMLLLYVGVPLETIFQKHTQMIPEAGWTMYDLLTHRYVRMLERKIRSSALELDSDDDDSIGMWTESYRISHFLL